MPIEVLTHKNSLVSKESYKKVLDRTDFFFIFAAKYARTCNWKKNVYKKTLFE